MKKVSYLFCLLFVASVVFISCRNDDDNNPGIGNPTSTTDPGVVIGEINGKPIRWATRNVDVPGTFVQNPQDAGRLFQWGTHNGVVHHWDNTTDGAPEGFNTARNRVAWTRANDPCPAGWRVPTAEELIALRNVGYSDWTELGGVNGRFFGTEQNHIFLPASGWRNGYTLGTLGAVGTNGIFWSSMGTGGENDSAWFLPLSMGMGVIWYFRSNAGSIRCVAE